MCGILASFDLPSVEAAPFARALELMHHRGPDYGDMVECTPGSFLGHRRLSILDLHPRSHQPFRRDGLSLIFNGEIYNYRELIDEHDLEVQTTSDTEVLLELYRKLGPACLDHFNGMFAFVIHDATTGDVFAARDRLGIKPLFYSTRGDGIVFSSEVAPILELCPSEIDDFGLRQYRKLRACLKGYTVYSGISSFLPGHYYLNGRFHPYWEVPHGHQEPPSDEELLWLLEDAIRLRQISDVPVGSYLSGGLDSTFLSFKVRPDHTWTVGFPELNEFEWANLANESLGSDHHQIVVTLDEFPSAAREMVAKRREPLSVPNEVLIMRMTQRVKTENTVVLSGEGADELFWGYDRIFRWANEQERFDLRGFDTMYCYGSHRDDEVLDFALEGVPGESVVDRVGYFFQAHHLHGLLKRLDHTTMLASVEARVPFVDHRLVERLAGVPFEWRMGERVKDPLKRLSEGLVPAPIIDRVKVGFPVPLDLMEWGMELEGTPMDRWLGFNEGALDETLAAR